MILTRLLKKWLNRVRFKLTKHKFKEVPETHFGRQYLEALACLLEPSLFKDVVITDARLTQTMGMASLSDLIKVLVNINHSIRAERPVANDWFTTITHVKRFDSFVGRDADDFYIELEPQIRQLQKQLIEFCSLMEPSDLADVGFYEHNRRVLTKFSCVVRQITIRLLENIHS